MKIAILISGGGSNMERLIQSRQGKPDGQISLVISNNADAAGLNKARGLGVQAHVIDHQGYETRDEFEGAIHALLTDHDVDLICLAGFMRILTPDFVAKWPNRIVNIHPSLLPKYPGLDTHARAIAAGDTAAGCTVHVVTGELDAGPILGQSSVKILQADTVENLAQRVLAQEHILYPSVLDQLVSGQHRG